MCVQSHAQRQQILILCLAMPDLKSKTIAWSLYDATKPEEEQMNAGDESTPPYHSVFAAMRDGWNVIQFAPLPQVIPGHEHDTGHLAYEYMLERKVAVHG
ncbi:hypothetical protein [Paenibacillus cymbidii]|uniref:hypothetical protein n=1 Tax=Paenibacillus cymbidii TaxID=1639034 RepID=UPI00108199E2|nr:hypothetical protein [Paenibacillus cymbidii]